MSVDADLHAASFEEVTLFSKATDCGQTWSAVRAINNNVHNSTNQNNQTIGNIIADAPSTLVDPRTRVLYNFFNQTFNTVSSPVGNPNGVHCLHVALHTPTAAGDTWT